MRKKISKTKRSLLLRMAFISVGVFLAFNVITIGAELAGKRAELESLRKTAAEGRLRNSELERVLSRGSDSDYIERIARDKLNFVYPHERVYIDITGS